MGSTKEGWIKRKLNGNGIPWNKGKRGLQVPWNKGLTKKDHPSISKMGFQKGHKKFTSEEGYKIGGQKRSGENHPLWKGGITPLRIKIWTSPEYKKWRTSVFERDNYTCQNCGQRGGRLEADHYPVPFSVILNKLKIEGMDNLYDKALSCDLFWMIDNGRTLCKQCHLDIGWSLFRENNPKRGKPIKYTA